jgi:hypothetical protein
MMSTATSLLCKLRDVTPGEYFTQGSMTNRTHFYSSKSSERGVYGNTDWAEQRVVDLSHDGSVNPLTFSSTKLLLTTVSKPRVELLSLYHLTPGFMLQREGCMLVMESYIHNALSLITQRQWYLGLCPTGLVLVLWIWIWIWSWACVCFGTSSNTGRYWPHQTSLLCPTK